MTASDDQAEAERAIFTDFAETVPLAFNSIESRQPPEPDLLCDVVGEGPVAFELGQVANEALERATSGDYEVRQQFRAAYNELPRETRSQIEACLGGPPAVLAGFTPGTPPGRWRRAITPILEFLVAQSNVPGDERLSAGEVPVWQVHGLSSLLTDLTVRASSTRRAFFGCAEMVEVVDATQRILTKKLTGPYRSKVPMELLLYWSAAPSPRTANWRDDIIASIRDHPQSPFRRVWCFDLFQRAVVLVHPARA